MKFKLWEIITFSVLVVLTIVFGLLKSLWGGFSYFSAASILVLAILFVVNRIMYIIELKKNYDDELHIYFAELLNNGLITKQQFQQKDEKVKKGYYKEYNRIKRTNICISIFLILIILGVVFFAVGIF